MTLRAALAATLALAACTARAPQPAPLDAGNEACGTCRMVIGDRRFAAQVAAPGELPRFFDDLACLAAYLASGPASAGAVAFVADHRTGAWVRAEHAVYTRVPSLATPMGSRLLAHADAASRERDPLARGGAPVALGELSAAAAQARGSTP